MKQKLVILSGSGVSAESGISTFRTNNGLWENHRVEDVAEVSAWSRNPQLMLDFYNTLRKGLKDKKPNHAHRVIAELEKDYDVTVVTQNVDNLHEKAGSTRIIHLHGQLTKVRPEYGIYDNTGREDEVIDIGYEAINLGDKSPDGRQLRPHIVWFGEPVPNIERAIDAVMNADVVLIVGTSLQVYPAASLYGYAKADTPIYIIDPADMPSLDTRITHIKKKATEGIDDFVKILQERK